MLKKRTPAIERIVIIGLGLMGGSLAKRVRKMCPELKVLAVDQDVMTLTDALKENVIHLGINDWRHYQPELGDMVVIALPSQCPDELLHMLDHVAAEHAICVMDLASTKSSVMTKVDELKHLSRYFIGGHPMVGKDTGGYQSSSDDLYNEAIFFMCFGNSRPKVQMLVENWVTSLKCHPIRMSPDVHDQMVAITSHFPHVLSYGLGELYNRKSKDLPELQFAVGTGFMSMSRLARSSPTMWADICANNKQGILPVLKDFINHLQSIKEVMEHGQDTWSMATELESVFTEGHLRLSENNDDKADENNKADGAGTIGNFDMAKMDSGQSQMSPELNMLRSQLDHIDAEIFDLLSKRFDCIRTIGSVKAASNLPVEDTGRENRLMEKLSKKVPERNVHVVRRLYANVFVEAKQIQGSRR